LVTQETIPLLSLPPLKSMASPLTINLMVGYPLTANFSANLVSTVASTLPKTTFLAFNYFAASAYSGVNFLQCPHHGA